MRFASDFMFGAATAAYQVEGAWNQDGKGMSNWDEFSKIPGKTFENTNGDVAIDHYNRYKEDIALMAEMGLQSYRFSIAWTRIFPKGTGEINPKGIKFYNNLIDECIKYGIVPIATLYHWDLPLTLEKEGGWLNKKTSDAFLEYATTCFREFGDRVKTFITFNETIIFCGLGYLAGAHPPGIKNDPQKYFQATHNVFYTHARTVLEYKKMRLYGEVGISHVFSPAFSVDNNPENIFAERHANAFGIDWYYDPVLKGEYPTYVIEALEKMNIIPECTKEELDIIKEAAEFNGFLGLNYYQPVRVEKIIDKAGIEKVEATRETSTGSPGNVSFDGVYRTVKMKDKKYTKWDWEISPEGFLDGLKMLKEKYGQIKIYITENGLGDEDPVIDGEICDIHRINYIKEHLQAIKIALREGINIKGYYAWSAIDLLSWLNGYKKQYGFIYVNHKKNLERKKKLSFYWYRDVIKSRGEDI